MSSKFCVYLDTTVVFQGTQDECEAFISSADSNGNILIQYGSVTFQIQSRNLRIEEVKQ